MQIKKALLFFFKCARAKENWDAVPIPTMVLFLSGKKLTNIDVRWSILAWLLCLLVMAVYDAILSRNAASTASTAFVNGIFSKVLNGHFWREKKTSIIEGNVQQGFERSRKRPHAISASPILSSCQSREVIIHCVFLVLFPSLQTVYSVICIFEPRKRDEVNMCLRWKALLKVVWFILIQLNLPSPLTWGQWQGCQCDMCIPAPCGILNGFLFSDNNKKRKKGGKVEGVYRD